MKRILFPQWGSLGQDFVVRAWKAAGYEIDSPAVPEVEPDPERRSRLAEGLVQQLLKTAYDFVFTVNYLPVVAIACKACRIRYVSWVYDSPCVELYSETVDYDTNYIFVFDRQTCLDRIRQGVRTIGYLPLAADVDYYDKIRLAADSPYRADVSFVGSLYSAAKPQFAPLERETGYLKGYLDGLVTAQAGVYGCNFLEQALPSQVTARMQQLCQLPQRVGSSETIGWIYANYYLARKVTARERTDIIRSLSPQYSLRLYAGSDAVTAVADRKNTVKEIADAGVGDTEVNEDKDTEIVNSGEVDYYHQAPLVFKGSKINLNISLRSIQSGIPLRAFDIMGCGGFLLTNYQADLTEHFVPGEDFIYYENQADLMDKVAYYLEHETERKKIAGNGYEKVKRFHTYRHRIEEILAVLGEG